MSHLVYVCDDDSHIVRAVSMKLKKAGLEVVSFPDGYACWEQVQERAPEMIITDLQMPRMNGLELCEKIREFEATRSIPLTLLTGKGFEFDHDEYMQNLKITNVMVKPFSPKKLLTQVQECLQTAPDTLGQSLKFSLLKLYLMRNYYTAIQFWSYSLLVVCLCPLAVFLGAYMHWPLGVAPLLLLAPPTVLAAVSSPRVCYWTITVLSISSCFAEIFFRPDLEEVRSTYPASIMCASVLVGLVLLIDLYMGKLRHKLSQMHDQNDELVRQLYQTQKQAAADASKSGITQINEKPVSEQKENTSVESGVNYPLLLLTLQDIGRRISTNQSNESLIPTVISTAKASLQCESCQVYLWDSKSRALKNALPARARDRLDYRPAANHGVAAWVIEHRQIVMRNDADQDYRLKRIIEDDPQMPDAIAPLTVGSELIGLLIIDKIDVDSPTIGRLIYILSNIYALGIKNSQLFKRIEEMASRDGLTGLYNHATFQEKLHELVKGAEAQSTSLSIIMSDIDHFKSFNDTYGHQAGDFVLKEVARIWKTVMPDNAVLARYGGEEFIGVLLDHEYSQARQIAEDLRETLENCPILFEGQQLQVTASFGVTEFRHPATNTKDLVRVADEYLYKAKEGGRNQVVGLDTNATRKPGT